MSAANRTLKHYVDTPVVRDGRRRARWLMRVGITAQGPRVRVAELLAEILREVDNGRRLDIVARNLRIVADGIERELADLAADVDARRAA